MESMSCETQKLKKLSNYWNIFFIVISEYYCNVMRALISHGNFFTWGWFYQCFTNSFYARRSQKCKKTQMTWMYFCAFGICMRKSCALTCRWNQPLVFHILDNLILLTSGINSWKASHRYQNPVWTVF